MKVLLDTCVWGGAKRTLAVEGFDVIWSGDWPQDPGDEEILAQAHNDGRVLVTLDKDFGELAIHYQQPHSEILRLVNISARQQGPICHRILQQYGEELLAGAIITADANKLRIRPPDN